MDDPVIRCLAYVVKHTFITLGVLLKFLSQRLLDLLGLIFNVIAICTIFRAPATIYYLFFSNEGKFKNRWKYTGLWQILIFIFDIPTILTFPFFLICPWRIVFVVSEVKKDKVLSGEDLAWEGFKIRGCIWKHFFYLLFDILFIPACFLLAVTWRNPRVRRRYLKFSEGDNSPGELKIKIIIIQEFLQLLGDVIFMPFLGLILVSWRSPIMIKEMKTKTTKSILDVSFKGYVFVEFFILMIDTISIPAFLVTMLSWRMPLFLAHCYSKNYITRLSLDNFYDKIRKYSWKNFFYFLLDIPVIISFVLLIVMFPVNPFRLISYLRTLKSRIFPDPIYAKDVNDETKQIPPVSIIKREHRERLIIVCLAIMALFEIFVMVTALVVMVTVWRFPFLIMSLRKFWKDSRIEEVPLDETPMISNMYAAAIIRQESEYYDYLRKTTMHTLKVWKIIGKQFTLLIIDLFMVVIFLIVMATLWRAVPLVQDISAVVKAADTLSSVNGMKLRKKIVMHFVFLLVDIPAIVLLILHLIIPIRLPAIVGAVIGSNFYLVFAMTVAFETGKLLVDLIFVVFFLLLCIGRPIDIWIHVLEDETHKKNRLSSEKLLHIKWLLSQRKKYTTELDEAFSDLMRLENSLSGVPPFVEATLASIITRYTGKLTTLRDELFAEELDDRLIYLVSKVIFFENKAAHIYGRRYLAEKIFLRSGSVVAHRRNLDLVEREEREWAARRDGATGELEAYSPEGVPLWGQTVGFMTRTRIQNQRTVVACLASGNFATILLSILATLLIYRAPSMYASMYRKFHLRRNIALKTLKEYALDAWMVIKVIIISLTIYKIPDVTTALVTGLYYKRSVKAARKAVDAIPHDIMSDLAAASRILLSWKTIAFTLTSFLFFIFMPLSIMINICRKVTTSLCLVYSGGLFLYVTALALPFIIIFLLPNYVTSSSSFTPVSYSHVFSGYVIFITIILFVFVVTRSRRKIAIPYLDYVRINWFNVHVYAKILIESVQITALIFSISGEFYPFKELHATVSRHVLFDFYDYRGKFGVMVFVFTMWFVTASVPLILEGILKYCPKNTFTEGHYTWRAFLHFFGSTLFMVIPEMSLSFLACDYSNCNGTVYGCAKLIDEVELVCWTGSHKAYAAISLFLLMWYLLTSVLICMTFDDSANRKVDLLWSQKYTLLENVLKILLVGSSTMYKNNLDSLIAIVVILFLNLVLVLIWKPVAGTGVTNSKKLLMWKVVSLIILFTVGVVIYVTEKLKVTSNAIMYGLLVYSMTLLLGCFIVIKCGVMNSFSEHEKARKSYRSEVGKLISKIESWNKILPRWKSMKPIYCRMLRNVRVAFHEDKETNLGDLVNVADTTVPDGSLPPPPTYDEVEALDLPPPPPSYDDVLAMEQNQLKSDEYFVPSSSIYLQPLGDWKPYDAAECVSKNEWMIRNAKEYYLALTDSICTGHDLLLLLEQQIHYSAFAFNFLVDVDAWRNKVKESDWIALLDCVRELDANTDLSYDRPNKMSDFTEADLLELNPDTSVFPEYFGISDSQIIKDRIHRRERQILLQAIPLPWKDLIAKLIPEEIPIIHRVTASKGLLDETSITVELFKTTNIHIVEVKEGGYKIAKGAKVVLPQSLNISEVSENVIKFTKPYVTGSKGPITRSVESFDADVIKGEWCIVIGKNKAKFKKISATLGKLEYTF